MNSTWLTALQRPVGGAPLALLRILCGLGAAAAVALLWSAADPLFLRPKFFFSYPGLSWLAPWPGTGVFWELGLLGAAALAIALGLFYRWACALFLLGAGHLLLLDRTYYQDVLYLGLALGFVMMLLPAHRRWSLDARRGAVTGGSTLPLWAPLAAGVLLAALLLAAVLALLQIYDPEAGPLVEQLRRGDSRPALFALLFSAAGLLLLLGPGWRRASDGTQQPVPGPPDQRQRVAGALLAVFLLAHIALPLRALVARGDSGWLDKDGAPLTAAECLSIFNVGDAASGRRWNVNPGTRLNARQTVESTLRPELVLQFAQHLAELFAAPKYGAVGPTVRARIKCTADGTHFALVLDPQRDLARLTTDELLQARIPFDPDARENPRRLRLETKPPDAPPN